MSDDAQILELRPRTDRETNRRAAPLKAKGPRSHCHHLRFELDREVGRVTCEDCGREVTAFQALEALEAHWATLAGTLEQLRREERWRREELESAKRRERNAKARARRHERRAELGGELEGDDAVLGVALEALSYMRKPSGGERAHPLRAKLVAALRSTGMDVE